MGDIIYDDRNNPQVNSSNAATIYEYSGSIAELLTEDIRDFPDFKFRNNAVFHFYCNDGVKYQVYTSNNMFFRDVQLDNAFGGGGGGGGETPSGAESLSAEDARKYATNPEDVSFNDSVGNVNQYSSLHYSKKSEDFSQASSQSASNAAQSEANASQSEANASQSESNASQSETNASNSASSAAQSETNASESAAQSQQSATASINARNEAEDFKDEAESFSNSASSSATTATNEANRAKSEADRAQSIADGVGGGSSDLSGRVTQNETDIDDLQTRMQTAESDINQNTNNITAIQNAGYVTESDVTNIVDTSINNELTDLSSDDISDSNEAPSFAGGDASTVGGQLRRLRENILDTFQQSFYTIEANTEKEFVLHAGFKNSEHAVLCADSRIRNNDGGYYTRRTSQMLKYYKPNSSTFTIVNQSDEDIEVKLYIHSAPLL